MAFAGERFSPAPPFFFVVRRVQGDGKVPSRVAAAASPPYLSAFGGQLFIARRCALRQRACAALRSPASYLLLAPLPCGKGVRSHPLRGALTALVVPGRSVAWGVRGALIVPGESVAGGVQTPDVARLLSLTFCPVQQSSFRAGSIREPISAIFLLSTTKGKLRNSPPGATRSGRRFGGGAKRPPPNSLSP